MVIKGYIFLSNKTKIHQDSAHCISVIFSSIFSHCSCLKLQLKMICTFWTVIKLQCTKERSGQTQFYIQLVFKATLCITLTIFVHKILSGSLFLTEKKSSQLKKKEITFFQSNFFVRTLQYKKKIGKLIFCLWKHEKFTPFHDF